MALFGLGGSNRAARIQQMQSDARTAEERVRQDNILKRQDKQHRAEMKLNKQALAEQQRVNAEITSALNRQTEIAERPAPPPTPPAAVMVTGGTAADVASNDDTAIDVRRRGRSALRISLNGPQTGGAQTGLNVPRG